MCVLCLHLIAHLNITLRKLLRFYLFLQDKLLVVIAFHFLMISSCVKQIYDVIVYSNQVIGNNNCRDLRWTEFNLSTLHIWCYVLDF